MENSQQHPVRFASLFICHISFYISKFFIPLQRLHASFMRSTAVFAGLIQPHFTCHTAAAGSPLPPRLCRPDEKFIVSCFNFLYFYFLHRQCEKSVYFFSSSFAFTLKTANEASLRPGNGSFVEDE